MLQGCEFQLTECPWPHKIFHFLLILGHPIERILNCCCVLKQREYIYRFTNRLFLFVYCKKKKKNNLHFHLTSHLGKRHWFPKKISKYHQIECGHPSLQNYYVLWFKIRQQYWNTVLQFYMCRPINIFFIKIIEVLFIRKDEVCLCECSFCLALPAPLSLC